MNLTNLFSSQGLFQDLDKDGLPDHFGGELLIARGLSDRCYAHAGNLAARITHELVAVDPAFSHELKSGRRRFPSGSIIVATGQWPGDPLQPGQGALLARPDGTILLTGDDDGLAAVLAYLACAYPRTGVDGGSSWEELTARAGIGQEQLVGVVVADNKIVRVLQGSPNQWDAKLLSTPLPLPRYNPIPQRPCPPIEDLGDLTRWRAGLMDTDGDGMPDDVAWPIVLTAKPSIHTVLAACHLSAGLALQSAGLSLPLVLTAEQVEMDQACLLVGGWSAKDSGHLHLTPQGSAILGGTGPKIEKAAAALARSWAGDDRNSPQKAWGHFIRRFWHGDNASGEATGLLACGDQLKPIRTHCHTRFPQPVEVLNQLQAAGHLPKLTVKELPVTSATGQEFSWPWEVDDLYQRLNEELLPHFDEQRPARSVVLRAFTSEPASIRQQMVEHIRQVVARFCPDSEVKVNVLSAYKPGLSWIMDELSPQLAALRTRVDKVKICYQPFIAPEGHHWMELPTRWLQELYPVDELLAAVLGISRDDITFTMAEPGAPTYQIAALDSRGQELAQWQLKCLTGERPYLTAFPERGLVHPPTAWVEVAMDDQPIRRFSLRTDLERAWDCYQDQVLPWVVEQIRRRGEVTADRQPFFARLALELWLSEEDQPLDLREERLSPLEAMHEDLYFAGLDFFSTLGQSQTGQPLRAPGAIVPLIHQRPGQGGLLRVSLEFDATDHTTVYQGDIYPTAQSPEWESIQPHLVEIEASQETQHGRLVFRAKSDSGLKEVRRRAEAWRQLAELQSLQADCPQGNPYDATLIVETRRGEVRFHFSSVQDHRAASEPGRLPAAVERTVLGYQDCRDILNELSSHQQVRVRVVGQSHLGRDVHLVELTSLKPTALWSRAKLLAAKPTYLVIARHHANEVSSTNAAFMLMRRLLADEPSILGKVNVAIIPMENPDGVELHHQLQQEHPTWKHHAARFSAVGQDLAAFYFRDQPDALTTTWQLWQPDVVGDNHGVPSHEWEQPFSGYVCPWYATFWLPRAFYYGYFNYVDDPDYPEHAHAAALMRQRVAQAIAQSGTMSELNALWQERYCKYGHQAAPTHFPFNPDDYLNGVLTYFSGFHPELKSTNAARRYPDKTVLWWIGEVNDETAQGDDLRLCAEAHLQANLAILHALAELPSALQREHTFNDGNVHLQWRRPRPLDVWKSQVPSPKSQ